MARPGLTTHRKFRRLARALEQAHPGLGRALARGYLELLWEAAYESGDEYVGTSDDVEHLVGWAGERGVLTRALVDAGAPEGEGFIEPADEVPAGNGPDAADRRRYRIHDLWHHAPDYVSKRRRRELERLGKTAPAISRTAPNGGQDPPTLDWQDGDVRPPSPSHSPSRSPSPGKDISAEPILLTFPTVGKDGHEWRLRRPQVDEWQAVYPNLDVMAECRRALSWVKANDGHRKTVKGMPKFLNGWLSRAVDSGRGRQVAAFSKTAGNVDAARRFVARGGAQ